MEDERKQKLKNHIEKFGEDNIPKDLQFEIYRKDFSHQSIPKAIMLFIEDCGLDDKINVDVLETLIKGLRESRNKADYYNDNFDKEDVKILISNAQLILEMLKPLNSI